MSQLTCKSTTNVVICLILSAYPCIIYLSIYLQVRRISTVTPTSRPYSRRTLQTTTKTEIQENKVDQSINYLIVLINKLPVVGIFLIFLYHILNLLDVFFLFFPTPKKNCISLSYFFFLFPNMNISFYFPLSWSNFYSLRPPVKIRIEWISSGGSGDKTLHICFNWLELEKFVQLQNSRRHQRT